MAPDDLSGFRFYTGARLSPLPPDVRAPALFRDLGAMAQERFLAGTLPRLAGPLSPLLFVRTLDYVEPYLDYEDIGRLVFLRPQELGLWFSGVPSVYVARASRAVPGDAVAYVPPGITLAEAARIARDVRDTAAFRETLGGRIYDEASRDARARLERLNREHARTELRAEPLRAAFQSSVEWRRDAARDEMRLAGIIEDDLCTAWHHLPRDRRAAFAVALERIAVTRLSGET